MCGISDSRLARQWVSGHNVDNQNQTIRQSTNESVDTSHVCILFSSWSCIERWLKGKGGSDKCPQCNAPAKKKDIRNIYTKAIKSIDTTERDRALADLEKETEARQKAEEREARALLQYQLAKAECEKIVSQLKTQEQLVFSLRTERYIYMYCQYK